jgi:hypothetical protein
MYCCDDSRKLFEQYYSNQQKGRGEFPVYVGRYTQKGHGIGNIIGSLFRRILPTLKAVAPHVLRTGANVLDDVSQGKTWKESAIKRIPEGISAFRQSGSGKRKRSAKRRHISRKRQRKDIFDGIHS